ncbi:DUF1992 domain-containing protein [Haloglycomyces albus]|uniref:DnaJ family domain-containing protein n=1 Tax=Haloglycomyces albus TaxID=526067 RepID=UPI00046CAD20|nr:DUF1992 domain-containing protein [Haloglycomyces albus]
MTKAERGIEGAIADAQRRGEFDNLPGAGKPLPQDSESYGEDWWLKQKSTRENIGADALPTTIKLARELDALDDTLAGLSTETRVRKYLDDLNTRLKKALMFPGDGPPLRRGLVQVDEAVDAWRSQRRDA